MSARNRTRSIVVGSSRKEPFEQLILLLFRTFYNVNTINFLPGAELCPPLSSITLLSQAAVPLASSPAYGYLYKATVETFPGDFFIFHLTVK
jgi:hypothetical protein